MMIYSNSLGIREAGSLIQAARSLELQDHRCGQASQDRQHGFLQHMSAAAELFVINLVAPHDPEPD
jgi:hypothetical protein